MAITFSKNYDTVKIVDIPENEISEKLKQIIKNEMRYQDVDGAEHLYNASQILELPNLDQIIREELEAIDDLCGVTESIYFRITAE